MGVLIAAAIAMTIIDAGGRNQEDRVGVLGATARGPSLEEPAESVRGGATEAATRSARLFVQAYLRYQEGRLRSGDRASLLRYSTSELGGQLLRAPVRLPPGSRFPRQFVARIAGLKAGVFEGGPALTVALVIAGRTGAHLLSASLIEQGGAWIVAGIGP
ncbi:MAG TPA: hypothetical protein VFU11_06915 [Solirubrobacterales bacterium]|nr:hypothetical protein [Solirubrobacterales bacterium]